MRYQGIEQLGQEYSKWIMRSRKQGGTTRKSKYGRWRQIYLSEADEKVETHGNVS
jgi:hypothetical protein